MGIKGRINKKTIEYLKILRPLAVQNLSSLEIAGITGLGVKQVQKILLRYNLPRLKVGGQKGSKNQGWKGGKRIDKNGYILCRKPDHPNNRNGYIREHRLVMEEKIGRFLTSSEVVHHTNCIKTDNRIENLELFQRNGEHLKKELKGKIPNWSAENKEKLLLICLRNAENKRVSSHSE